MKWFIDKVVSWISDKFGQIKSFLKVISKPTKLTILALTLIFNFGYSAFWIKQGLPEPIPPSQFMLISVFVIVVVMHYELRQRKLARKRKN